MSNTIAEFHATDDGAGLCVGYAPATGTGARSSRAAAARSRRDRPWAFNAPGLAVTLSVLGHAGALLAVSHGSSAAAGRAREAASLWVTTPEPELFDADLATVPPASAVKTAANVPLLAPIRAATAHVQSSAPAPSPKLGGPLAQPESVAPAVSPVEAGTGPRFAITLAPTVGSTRGGISSARSGAAPASAAAEAPIAAAAADVPATLRAGVAPRYTARALAAGVEANVPLEIVVNGRGEVTSARALERVGYGLDEAALNSVLGYRFTPARRGGVPVAVRMAWLMRFQLQ